MGRTGRSIRCCRTSGSGGACGRLRGGRRARGASGRGGRSGARRWKARCAYGWAFAARLVPLGIWEDVSLVVTGEAWLRDAAVYTNLSNDLREAAVSVVLEFGARREIAVTVRAEITLHGF